MTHIRKGTWVLIADGEKALFLRNDLDEENLDLNVVRIEEQDNPSDREQSANRPGRMQDTGVGQRSGDGRISRGCSVPVSAECH